MSDDERQIWERDDYGEEDYDDLDSQAFGGHHLDQDFAVKGEEYVDGAESVGMSDLEDEQLEQQENDDIEQEPSEVQKLYHPLDLLLQDDGIKQSAVRKTFPWLSKYQRAHVLGKRAEQISKNSPIYVQLDAQEVKKLNPLQIAELQLEKGKIPFILRRLLPNGYYEDWKLSQLKIN